MKKSKMQWMSLGLCIAISMNGCAANFFGTATAGDKTDNSELMTIAQIVEDDVTPSEMGEHTVRKLSSTADGDAFLTTTDKQAMPHAYKYVNGEWQEANNNAIISWIQDNQIYNRKYYYDATGSWWAVSWDGDSITQILPNGQARDVILPEGTWANKFISIRGFADRGDGLVCFAANQTEEKDGPDPGGVWFLVDCDTGEVTQSFSEDYGFDYQPVFYGENLVIYDYAGTVLKEYNPETGQLVQEISIERPDSLPTAATMTVDGIYHYFVNNVGLYRRPLNGDFTQTVTDDILLNCMASRFEAMGLYEEADGTYLIAGNLNGKMKLYHISIEETNVPAKASTLTIWALDDSPMLQIAAQRYQSLYPDIDLNVVIGRSEEKSSLSDEDILRQLNTDLLSGEGPDCLVLDGLPVESYIRQGMLQDLTGIEEESEYYQNILNSFQSDTGLYVLPAFFTAPVFASTKTDMTPTSLEELTQLFEKGDCTAGSWKEVFEAIYPAVANSIYLSDNTLDTEALTDFIEQTNRMIQSRNITQEKVAMGSGTGNLTVISEIPTSRFSMQNGDTNAAIFNMSGISQAVALLTQCEGVKLSPLLSGTAEGKFLLGIRAETENLEAAQKFIRMMLEDEQIQQSNMYGGMAVHKDYEQQALQQIIQNNYTEEERSGFVCNPLEYSWSELAEQYTGLVNPSANGTLRDVIYKQAVQVYGGQISVEQAVNQIIEQVRLYLQEQA